MNQKNNLTNLAMQESNVNQTPPSTTAFVVRRRKSPSVYTWVPWFSCRCYPSSSPPPRQCAWAKNWASSRMASPRSSPVLPRIVTSSRYAKACSWRARKQKGSDGKGIVHFWQHNPLTLIETKPRNCTQICTPIVQKKVHFLGLIVSLVHSIRG